MSIPHRLFRADYFSSAPANIVQFGTCINKEPAVHMVTHSFEAASSGSRPYKLKPISDHAKDISAFVAINGVIWTGNLGATLPLIQTSTPHGTQIAGGLQLFPESGTTASAEAIIGLTEYDPTSGTLAEFFDKPAGTLPNLSIYDHDVFSTTTSIIKAGVCTASAGSPGINTLQSALGIQNGYLIMLSSVSGEESTSYELCQVFMALGVENAIRLDGSVSASLYVNGVHLNPLTGFDYLLIGNERNVVNAITVK